MSDQPITGKVGLDVTEFKSGIAEINREIRVIESGFRASAAALGDWGKSADGLEQRIKALTSTIGLQQSKVAALQGEYERIAAAQGAGSRAAQDMQVKLNKETETLNKMKVELSGSEQALAEMAQESDTAAGKVDELGQQEDQTRESTSKLSGVMNGLGTALKVGVTALVGIATAAAGAGLAIGKLVLDTAKASGELVDLSAKTGISTERLQELAYVGDQVGTSSETMTGSLARLTRSMDDANTQAADYAQKLAEAQAQAAETGEALVMPELGEAAAAFATLGVSVADSNGNLRDSEAVFSDAINALGGIANETERDTLAMAIFGRSAMELNPLIKAGSEEIARLSQEARDMGAVMSGEDVAAMEAFDDSMSSLQAGLKGTLGTLATAFLPALEGLAGQAKGYLGELAKVVQESDGDLGKMATGLGSLLGRLISDAAKQAPQMLQAGLNIVQGVINAITVNLPALVTGAVGMITSLVQFLISNLPMLMDAGVQLVLALVNGIVPQLPMLIESAIQMVVTLAEGIAEAIPQLIPVITEVIPQIITTLVENLPLLIDAALKIIIALADGLIKALPDLIKAVPEIMQAIFDALIAALPLIGEAAVELIVTLVEGIIGALPSLGPAAVKIITVLGQGLTDLKMKVLEMGVQIVVGVWNGITSRAAWFGSQIKQFFQGIIDEVKETLGIHSPSTVFAEMGGYMATGLGQGFAKSFRSIEQQIGSTVAGLETSVRLPDLAGAGAMASGSSVVNLGGITIDARGAKDAQAVARATEQGVKRALRAVGAV